MTKFFLPKVPENLLLHDYICMMRNVPNYLAILICQNQKTRRFLGRLKQTKQCALFNALFYVALTV